jgi:hypothetical protein
LELRERDPLIASLLPEKKHTIAKNPARLRFGRCRTEPAVLIVICDRFYDFARRRGAAVRAAVLEYPF